jgi:hypothetical protein
MTATKIGSLKCRLIQFDESELDITLQIVKYVPELWVNLLRINKALKNGHKLINKGLSICLSKVSASTTFDRVIRTTNGSVSGIKLSVNESPVSCNTIIGSISGKKIDIKKFHKMLGHCRLDRLENTAGREEGIRSGVWDECARTATFLSNITPIKSKEKFPYQLMFGNKLKSSSSLKIFREMGVVTTKDDIQSKLKKQGVTYMFMVYSVDHGNDVYRILNLHTKRIINTREFAWLRISYKTWSKNQIQQEDSNNEDFIKELIH